MADFKVPRQPVNLLEMPFADEGNRTVIPSEPPAAGRASLQSGFPSETQLPLRQGGVAPNRMDFNGILNMLSAFAFWQQSGGMFSYGPALNYSPPAIVYHNNILWWCLASNGPGITGTGVVSPGTNAAIWVELFNPAGSAAPVGRPTKAGELIWTTCVKLDEGCIWPDGQLIDLRNWPDLRERRDQGFLMITTQANRAAFPGYWVSHADNNFIYAPNLGGLFPRFRNPSQAHDAGRSVGSLQSDAIRNITGRVGLTGNSITGPQTGAFFGDNWNSKHHNNGTNNPNFWAEGINFDASRVVPTAAENRPVNVAMPVMLYLGRPA